MENQITDPTTQVTPMPIVSDSSLQVIEFFFDLFIVTVLSLVGIVTNVLDIVIFAKLGFKDSVNISMTTIAVWDLVKCACSVVARVKYPLILVSEVYHISWENMMIPTFVYVQVLSSYVSYLLAAYVSFERCLCVSIPLQVKTIITPRFTLMMMIAISLVTFGLFVGIFFIYDIRWEFSPLYNQTIAIYTESDFLFLHGPVFMPYFTVFGLVHPFLSFFVIVICTLIIVYHLRKMSMFRAQAQVHQFPDGPIKSVQWKVRDRQVIRMLLVIILVYIITLLPRFVHHIGKMLEPEFYYRKTYGNLFQVSVYVVFVSDFINASVNFFIFITMSSNFREMFQKTFPFCLKNKKSAK